MAMNKDLVAKWNAVVGPKDSVFHLGDFGFGPPAKLIEARKQLNGKIILIKGNHDKKPDAWLAKGDEWHMSLTVETSFGKAFLTHVPPTENPFDKYRKVHINQIPPGVDFVLHGHTHGAKPTKSGNLWCIDIGVDAMGLEPVAIDTIVERTKSYEIEVFQVQKDTTDR